MCFKYTKGREGRRLTPSFKNNLTKVGRRLGGAGRVLAQVTWTFAVVDKGILTRKKPDRRGPRAWETGDAIQVTRFVPHQTGTPFDQAALFELGKGDCRGDV